MLRTLLYSSRLEVLTSKGISSFLYFLFGVAISAWWVSVCYQFLHAYFTLSEFDVPVGGFIFSTLVFFMPVVMFGAFMLATFLQRFRLKLWFKKIVNYPLYESMMRPAEAGFIVDYEFSSEEVHATLLDLHFRGIINLTKSGKNILVKLMGWPDSLNGYERKFLTTLFDGKGEVQLKSLADNHLLYAGHAAHQYLADSLSNDGRLLKVKRPTEKQRKLVKLITVFGTRMGLVFLILGIFKYDEVTTILYPRFPVHVSEILVLLCVSLIWVWIVSNGFSPDLSKNLKSRTAAWLEAEGFKQYLQTVYKDRMSLHNISTQDDLTVKNIMPFMVAYNIIHLSDPMLDRLLVR